MSAIPCPHCAAPIAGVEFLFKKRVKVSPGEVHSERNLMECPACERLVTVTIKFKPEFTATRYRPTDAPHLPFPLPTPN